MVKNTVREGNVEKELLTRITTRIWKDAEGKAQSKQFVNMTGYHQRTVSS